jgi:hypothetical protein
VWEAGRPQVKVLGPVVAEPDNDRVFANLQPVDGVENFARTMVELGQDIRVVSVSGFSIEIGVGQGRQVWLRTGDEGEERYALPHALFHEPDGTLIQVGIPRIAKSPAWFDGASGSGL